MAAGDARANLVRIRHVFEVPARGRRVMYREAFGTINRQLFS